eukprot:TRINITY_DN3992_c0_g1_i1.p1 TRINITY_DN3992_c0_g1~~TRINITY_DN3992_c0_g1_i1.p1  ORF type:complete len:574 (+),score=121.80 TRINITY_DN3992_c0_g1_i1:185-1906(+)
MAQRSRQQQDYNVKGIGQPRRSVMSKRRGHGWLRHLLCLDSLGSSPGRFHTASKTEDYFGTAADIRSMERHRHFLHHGWNGVQLRVLTRDVSLTHSASVPISCEGATLCEFDLACIQGIHTLSQLDELRRAGTAADLRFSRSFHQGAGRGSLVVLSRYPITSSYMERFHVQSSCGQRSGSAGRSGSYSTQEGVGLVRVATPAGLVDVYTAALHTADDVTAAAQAFQLAHFVHHTARSPLSLLAVTLGGAGSKAYALQLSVAALRDVRQELALAPVASGLSSSAVQAFGIGAESPRSSYNYSNADPLYSELLHGNANGSSVGGHAAATAAAVPAHTSFLLFRCSQPLVPQGGTEPVWVATSVSVDEPECSQAAPLSSPKLRARPASPAPTLWQRLRRHHHEESSAAAQSDCNGVAAVFTAVDPDSDDVTAQFGSGGSGHVPEATVPLRGPLLMQLRRSIDSALDSGPPHTRRLSRVVTGSGVALAVVLMAGLLSSSHSSPVTLLACAAAVLAAAAAAQMDRARRLYGAEEWAHGLREVAAELHNFESHLHIDDAYPTAVGMSSQPGSYIDAHYQ